MKTISNKTAVTGLSGTAVVLLVYIVGLFGVELPAEIAAAVVTVATALIGYLVPAKQGSYIPENAEEDLLEDTGSTSGEEAYEDPDQSPEGVL